MHAVVAPPTWDTDAAAEVVIGSLERSFGAEHPAAFLAQKSTTMVDAFLDALARQGLSLAAVASGEWIDVEWLAAEISVQGDWRGLPSDPYDFDDARGVARTLLTHVRAHAA